MKIHLPKELESSIEAVVSGGHFASVDEAMAEAARLLLKEPRFTKPLPIATDSPDPLLGSMRDFADEMDEIVADAYRLRRDDQGRKFDL